MTGDPKKVAALVLGNLPPPDKLKSSGSADGGEVDGKSMSAVSAVRAFFEAGKSGDYEGAASALGQAMKLCESDDSDKDEPTDGE